MAADPVWAESYRDEMDAAWLYRTLAGYERDQARQAIFERLAMVAGAAVRARAATIHFEVDMAHHRRSTT